MVPDQDFQQFVTENGLHNPVERSGRASERHPIVLKQPEGDGESCVWSVHRCNFYVIIGRGGEQFSTTKTPRDSLILGKGKASRFCV